MTVSRLFEFNQKLEQSLAIIEQTPWVKLRLKMLNQLYESLFREFDDPQRLPFRLELDARAQRIIHELSNDAASFQGFDPDELLRLHSYLNQNERQQDSTRLEYLIIVVLFKVGAKSLLQKFLPLCPWIQGVDTPGQPLSEDLASFQKTFLNKYARCLPGSLVNELEQCIGRDQYRSANNEIRGLFVVGGGDQQTGLVANLSLENLKVFKRAGTNQLRIATHLVDEQDALADQGHALFAWLRTKYTDKLHGHLRLEFTLSELSSVLTGSSIGLGLGLLAQMALYGLNNNRAFEPRIYADVAMTGALAADGSVLPVNSATIKHKLEAAFFSTVKTLVLPRDHQADAEVYLADLSSKYPLRHMQLVFISHIDEVEHHKLVFFYQRRRAIQRTRQFFREYANFVTVSTMLFILALGAGFWFGIVKDPRPTSLVIDHEIVKVKNQFNFTLWTSQEKAHQKLLCDLNGDGNAEVLISYNRNAVKEIAGKLFCYDYLGALKWVFDGGQSVRYGYTLYDDFFIFDYLSVFDFDNDGQQEIYGYTSQTYFPNRLFVLATDGSLLSEYWNAGGFAEMTAVEVFSGNSNMELAVAGRNNEYRSGILLIIDPFVTHGISPQVDEAWIKEDYTPGNELYYIKFPFTHYIKTGRRDQTSQIIFNSDEEIRVLLTNENQLNGSVYYTFNNRMAVVFTALDDNYYKNYPLVFPNAPDLDRNNPALLDSFKKVEYWNGSSWVLKPTPNLLH